MRALGYLLVVCVIVGCSSGDAVGDGGCADVIAAAAERGVSGAWTFSATVRSADTGWEKYADAWEVVGPGGAVLGIRELAHPHVDEQPFTRSLAGVEVPPGTVRVTLRARDSVSGFCGEEFVVELNR